MDDLPLWLRILSVAVWILSGASCVAHFNLRRKHQKAIRFNTIRFLRSLRDAPLSFLHTSSALLLLGFRTVYGRTWRRRLIASALLSFSYTSIVLGSAYWFSDYLTQFRPDKEFLERVTDPELYTTSPYDRSFAFASKLGPPVTPESNIPTTEYIHHDKKSREIREHVGNFPSAFQVTLESSSDRDAIAILTLLEGTYLKPRPQLVSLTFLFIFNASVDFGAFLLTFLLLTWISKTPSIFRYCLGGSCALAVAALLFLVTLLPYGELTSGNTGIFWQLFLLPLWLLWLVAMVVGGLVLTGTLLANDGEEVGCFGPIMFFAGLSGGYFLISELVASFRLTIPALSINGNFNYVPYLLAASGIIPAILCCIGMSVLVAFRLGGESARRVVYWYLMWVVRVNKPILVVFCLTPTIVVELVCRLYKLFM